MVQLFLTCLALLLVPGLGYHLTSRPTVGTAGGRRDCFHGMVGVAAGILSGVCIISPQKAQAVISKELCASGQGSGCEDLAEGNEFIKSLQQKSAANAEMYARVSSALCDVKSF